MQFTNPIWLFGLTGLLIPIGIHLLSRKESNVIRIGSLRHLEESNTRQSVSLRLNEILLLAVRCLLITIVVLLLSGMSLNRFTAETWLVIENGLENDPDFKPLIDSLQQKGYKTYRLADGFPALESDRSTGQPNYWVLAEELGLRPLDQAVVLSSNRANGFRGKRPPISKKIRWISKDPAPADFTAAAIKISPDSILLRTAHTSAERTGFDSKTIRSTTGNTHETAPGDSITIQVPDTLTITIAFDAEFEYDKKDHGGVSPRGG